MFPPTVVIRHRKENLKKCSLRGLESRSDFRFFRYPTDVLPELPNYILLDLQGPLLKPEDRSHGLLVIDGTWRYASKMMDTLTSQQSFIHRSLPEHYRTAYPRRQEDCPDPARGLSSLEAIFLAYMILGRDTSGLLNNYYWRDSFLKYNSLA